MYDLLSVIREGSFPWTLFNSSSLRVRRESIRYAGEWINGGVSAAQSEVEMSVEEHR
jgi:hypothetical protein